MPDVLALVMAGGRGERMRASGIEVPKPLVPVGGVALLERNVQVLLHWGLREIVVAVPEEETRVAAFCRTRLQPQVAAAGGGLEVLVEARPLGNMGAAGLLAGRAEALLVVFADNLTALDLPALLAFHRDSCADLTLATHDHPFRIPYGRLEIEGDLVKGYTEKPTLSVPVASAVSVLGPAAQRAVPSDRPTGLVDLTHALLASGGTVAAYRHQVPWVDVNSGDSLAAAESLVAANRWLFPVGRG